MQKTMSSAVIEAWTEFVAVLLTCHVFWLKLPVWNIKANIFIFLLKINWKRYFWDVWASL